MRQEENLRKKNIFTLSFNFAHFYTVKFIEWEQLQCIRICIFVLIRHWDQQHRTTEMGMQCVWGCVSRGVSANWGKYHTVYNESQSIKKRNTICIFKQKQTHEPSVFVLCIYWWRLACSSRDYTSSAEGETVKGCFICSIW